MGETEELLAEQGLTFESVPDQRQFVKLRSILTIASGGMLIAAFDPIHSDNAALSICAATALNLDLAVLIYYWGILVSHGRKQVAIFMGERSAQFGIITAGHIYTEVLSTFFSGNSHIPSEMIVGCKKFAPLAISISRALLSSVVVTGLCTLEGE